MLASLMADPVPVRRTVIGVALVAVCLVLGSCTGPAAAREQSARRAASSDNVRDSGGEESKGDVSAGDILGRRRLLHYVKPVYPERLRRRHVEGVVRFRVLVGPDGVPQSITYVNGPKELASYAARAVRAWRYQPAVIGGHPTAFVTDAAVPFTLSR